MDALFTRTQRRVLSLLFVGQVERTLNQLIRESGGGSGAIRREVERMTAAGLLRERRVGNQRRFSADRSSPLYPELAALAAKAGTPASLRRPGRARPSAMLIAGRGEIRQVLTRSGLSNPRVFGSVARGDDTESSDLDLLVDARPDTSLLDLMKAKHALEDALGVPVDLVTPGDLPESFRAAVLATAVPL